MSATRLIHQVGQKELAVPPELTLSGMLLLVRPGGHRLQDAMGYHLRAGDSRSERAVEDGFVKAVMLEGAAVEIEIRPQGDSYAVRFAADQPVSPWVIEQAAIKLLGITPAADAFAARFQNDLLLGPAINRRPGLIIPQLTTPFEALAWAITGQQISLIVAHRIRKTLIERVARPTPNGMLVFPDAAAVAALGPDELRRCGYSRNKTRAVTELAEDIVTGRLVLPATLGRDVNLWRARLLERFGFGPWTVEYSLLRGWGYPDADLVGDAVVRRALGVISARYGAPRRRSLTAYRPWRSFAAIYLWAEMAQSVPSEP